MNNIPSLALRCLAAVCGAVALDACVATVQPAPVAMTTTAPMATTTPVVAAEGGERPDHRCGPEFGGARCGPNRCCSMFAWCGSPGEDHCAGARGFSGEFDGPGAPPR